METTARPGFLHGDPHFPEMPDSSPSTSGRSSFSDGSSPIQTTTYTFELMVEVGTNSETGPYAYNCQRGLFFAHGRSSVAASISASLHVVLPHRTIAVAWRRSRVDPSRSVRVPGEPST